LAGGHQLAQREHRRCRVRPRQRVDDGDGLRRSHADWRRNEEHGARTVRRQESARGCGAEAQGARTVDAKCER
jgi:hypothetical protein